MFDLREAEASSIAERDNFYMSNVNETGWQYVSTGNFLNVDCSARSKHSTGVAYNTLRNVTQKQKYWVDDQMIVSYRLHSIDEAYALTAYHRVSLF